MTLNLALWTQNFQELAFFSQSHFLICTPIIKVRQRSKVSLFKFYCQSAWSLMKYKYSLLFSLTRICFPLLFQTISANQCVNSLKKKNDIENFLCCLQLGCRLWSRWFEWNSPKFNILLRFVSKHIVVWNWKILEVLKSTILLHLPLQSQLFSLVLK